MSKCERTRLLGEAWNPAQGLKWVWGPCQATSLWCGALLSRGASWEGEFHHWKTLASEVTGNLKLNWRGRECYWTWKSNAKHEVCVFQVVWLWYLTGVSSQLADLFPLLNRLSRDIECGAEHMTRSLLQRNKGQECLGAREALSGKVDTGRHVYAGFILLSKVPETFPEGHLTVQVTDRPIWSNSLRERTMACLCSVSESPKFLPETEIKLRFHSVGQRSCNRVNLWKLKIKKISKNSWFLPRGNDPLLMNLNKALPPGSTSLPYSFKSWGAFFFLKINVLPGTLEVGPKDDWRRGLSSETFKSEHL